MNFLFWLKLFGHDWTAKQIKRGLDKNLSPAGRNILGANLQKAGSSLQTGDTQDAAMAITDVLFAIH